MEDDAEAEYLGYWGGMKENEREGGRREEKEEKMTRTERHRSGLINLNKLPPVKIRWIMKTVLDLNYTKKRINKIDNNNNNDNNNNDNKHDDQYDDTDNNDDADNNDDGDEEVIKR